MNTQQPNTSNAKIESDLGHNEIKEVESHNISLYPTLAALNKWNQTVINVSKINNNKRYSNKNKNKHSSSFSAKSRTDYDIYTKRYPDIQPSQPGGSQPKKYKMRVTYGGNWSAASQMPQTFVHSS